MLLEKVYDELRQLHLCSSAYKFSVNYLGKSPSYFSVLKARNEEPSIEALVTLEAALNRKACLYGDAHPCLTRTRKLLVELAKEVGAHRALCVTSKLTLVEYS
jgi:hypothetical protein